ncbi:hypothetical protein NVP1077O_63 [Vibrio phage 1.077.O._10N.261.45.A10]|nr:hypothetical protein NVP1070O_63 [Vibrio phage 1.070.O._10N.261.45.B2]AUR85641.1 hypothetical protein NVP1077O_63 [Vibrio phage 1.077.O._10N.261.45.A10]
MRQIERQLETALHMVKVMAEQCKEYAPDNEYAIAHNGDTLWIDGCITWVKSLEGKPDDK